MSDFGEKKLISDFILPLFKSKVNFGLGDDAAMIKIGKNILLATTDKIPEDLIAIQLDLMSPEEHGRYLIAVNISDIAAMGGVPLAILLNLSFPKDFSFDYFIRFLNGIKNASAEFSTPIVGGDTKWGTVPCLTATCLGLSTEKRVLRRNGAKIGEVLCVSGEIGLFSTALIYFCYAKPKGVLLNKNEEEQLRKKLTWPLPKVKLGKYLGNSGYCTSCMDITDGFGQSIKELSESSNVSFQIFENQIPCNKLTYKLAKMLKCDWIDIAFGVGLDLELLFTLNEQHILKSKDIICIGKVIPHNENQLKRKNSIINLDSFGGWEHFLNLNAIDVVLKRAKLL